MQSQPKKISETTLKLLYSLFISNTPQNLKDDWQSNFVRIFSELEYAHWFYLDNCLYDKNEVGLDLFGLCQEIFNRFQHLVPKKIDWKEKFLEWKRYRGTTCTGSAIILDDYLSMVLLVKGFNSNRWTFPGGKVGEGETLQDCAIREVMEETGLDIEHRMDQNLFLEITVGETTHRAYIVERFPRINQLQPSTHNEIEVITWFSLASLPSNSQDNSSVVKMNLKPNHFYCVIPFVKRLREYVKLRKQGIAATTALERLSTRKRSPSSRPSDSTSCCVIPTSLAMPSLLTPDSAATVFDAPLSKLAEKPASRSRRRRERSEHVGRKGTNKPKLTRQIRASTACSESNRSSVGGAEKPKVDGGKPLPLLLRFTPSLQNNPKVTPLVPQFDFLQSEAASKTRILDVDSSGDTDNIWSGRVVLNEEALVNILAPMSRPSSLPPVLGLFAAAN